MDLVTLFAAAIDTVPSTVPAPPPDGGGGGVFTFWTNMLSGSVGVVITLLLTGWWNWRDEKSAHKKNDLKVAFETCDELIGLLQDFEHFETDGEVDEIARRFEEMEAYWSKVDYTLGRRLLYATTFINSPNYKRICTGSIQNYGNRLDLRKPHASAMRAYFEMKKAGSVMPIAEIQPQVRAYSEVCSMLASSLKECCFQIVSQLKLKSFPPPPDPPFTVPDEPTPPLWRRAIFRLSRGQRWLQNLHEPRKRRDTPAADADPNE